MPDDKNKKPQNQAATKEKTKAEANQELSDEQLGKVAGGGKYDLKGNGYGGGDTTTP